MATEHTRETRQERLQTDAPQSFNLAGGIEQLRGEPEYAANGRNGTTLVKNSELRVVLEVLQKGGALAEHRAPGPITVQVLEGEIEFRVEETVHTLRPGLLLTVPARQLHAVQAVEQSAFLLTIAPLSQA